MPKRDINPCSIWCEQVNDGSKHQGHPGHGIPVASPHTYFIGTTL